MKRVIRQFTRQGCLRRWIPQFIVSMCLLILLLLATANWWLAAIGYWLHQPEQLRQVDAVVVLGGGNSERLRQGVTLYQQGLTPEIWHTGDIVWPGQTISDARSATRQAIAQGIPAEAVHLLTTTSTWEDGEQVAAFAQQRQIDSLLLVTDWWHSRRALCALHHHMDDSVTIYFSPASSSFGPTTWWHSETGRTMVTRELLKSGYYWLRYGMVPCCC